MFIAMNRFKVLIERKHHDSLTHRHVADENEDGDDGITPRHQQKAQRHRKAKRQPGEAPFR